MSRLCHRHGPDVEPEIVALIPCPPGWYVAHMPITNSDNRVWTDPVAAWAHVLEPSEPGCSCRDRRVRALIAGEFGSLEFADDDSYVQPPGFIAVWEDERYAWSLRDAAPSGGAR